MLHQRSPLGFFSFVMVVFMMTTLSLKAQDNNVVSNDEISKLESDVFKLVNQHRESKGLGTLLWSDSIYTEAIGHSHNMATGVTPFSHEGFDKRVDRLKTKFDGLTLVGAGENVATGILTAKQVTNNWLHSTGHKRNIEGDYNYAAVAIEKDSNGVFWFTQLFLKLKSN